MEDERRPTCVGKPECRTAEREEKARADKKAVMVVVAQAE